VRVSCVVDVSVDPDEGDVVEEVARVVLVVDEDVDDVELDVRVKLRVVVHVPFANTNSVHQKNKVLDHFKTYVMRIVKLASVSLYITQMN